MWLEGKPDDYGLISMQLNLFDDNKGQILLNCLNDCLQQLDFDRAELILEQLREECPEESATRDLECLVAEWANLLSDPAVDWQNPEHLHQIWLRATTLSHMTLKQAVVSYLVNCLLSLPEAHRIYIPPRFHVGLLLMAMNRHNDAAGYLRAAMGQTEIPPGKLMVWYADVQLILKCRDEALQWYLSACLLDPCNVVLDEPAANPFKELLISLRSEDDDDEVDAMDEVAWLPVWAALQGLFGLPLLPDLQELLLDGRSLAVAAEDHDLPVPQRWFYLLLLAEEQRKCHVDTVLTRRTMKTLNPFMFHQYIKQMVVHTCEVS